MTEFEFNVATSDMEAFYEKSLNPTQKKIWFDELKGYSTKRYAKAIQRVFKTQQYRPTLSTLLDILRTTQEENDVPTEPVPCEACKGTGVVLYRKTVNGREYEFASLCGCSNAVGKGYDGRYIADKEHKSDYYLPKIADVFQGGEI